MKIVPSETITVDNKQYAVCMMSPELKELVSIFDELRKDLEVAKHEHIKCQLALNDIGNQIKKAIILSEKPSVELPTEGSDQ